MDGDDTELCVHVGPGARLLLRGTAATVALPGARGGASSSTVRIEIDTGGSIEYLPEPTVLSARAEHRAELRVDLAEDARARTKEMLVLGRWGEPAGNLSTSTHATRAGYPLLRQRLDLGSRWLAESPGYLAGARVLATETLLDDVGAQQESEQHPRGKSAEASGTSPAVDEALSGQWCSLTPLARPICTTNGFVRVMVGRDRGVRTRSRPGEVSRGG